MKTVKLSPVLKSTLDQFLTTCKETSSQWVKFAGENSLTQKVKGYFGGQESKKFKTKDRPTTKRDE